MTRKRRSPPRSRPRKASAGSRRRVAARAHAKVNLDLRVLGTRPDGYHELRTVFQTIELHDTNVYDGLPTPTVNMPELGNFSNLTPEQIQEALIAWRQAERKLRRLPDGEGDEPQAANGS